MTVVAAQTAKSGHKYVRREPDGRGGWRYWYYEPGRPRRKVTEKAVPEAHRRAIAAHEALKAYHERRAGVPDPPSAAELAAARDKASDPTLSPADRFYARLMLDDLPNRRRSDDTIPASRDTADSAFRDALDALTIWTNGHVAAVRHPERFDAKRSRKAILGTSLFGTNSRSPHPGHMHALTWTVPPPTQADYERAHAFMVRLAAQDVTPEDAQDGPFWRGYALPLETLTFLRKGDTVDLGDVASFADVEGIAHDFAQLTANRKGRSNFAPVLFVLPKLRRGARVPHSAYPGEAEFVTSGDVHVTGIRKTDRCWEITLEQRDDKLVKGASADLQARIQAAIDEVFDAPLSAQRLSPDAHSGTLDAGNVQGKQSMVKLGQVVKAAMDKAWGPERPGHKYTSRAVKEAGEHHDPEIGKLLERHGFGLPDFVAQHTKTRHD